MAVKMCPYPLHCTTCDFLKLHFVCFLLSKLFLKKQTEDRILSDSDNGNNHKKQEYKLLFLFLKLRCLKHAWIFKLLINNVSLDVWKKCACTSTAIYQILIMKHYVLRSFS